MKVDDIRVRAQLTSGLQINSATGLIWAKEAIEDICSKYYNAGKDVAETATVTDPAVNYTIAKPILKLMNVSDLGDAANSSYNPPGYRLNDDNTITFNKAGAYKVEYKAMPDMPGTTSSEIPLPSLYHPCIEFYLAYKMRARLFGQGDNNAASYLQQYDNGLDNAEIARLRQAKKRRIPYGRGI